MASVAPLSSGHLPVRYPQFQLILTGIEPSQSKCEFSGKSLLMQRSEDFLRSIPVKKGAIKCFSESKERESVMEVLNKDGGDVVRDDVSDGEVASQVFSNRSVGLVRSPISDSVPGDSLNLGIRKPVYEVVEVRSDGNVSTRKNNETTLLEVQR
ncbi:magnesium transporter MRS2-11, chloroplastic-like [Olea europaea var. sylvestris]|uniref:magnesium transporter MRS2-11, chloroplastic-like n=1 Tax=Olea europaea var. sylvestris TaxID=158386 RepID=UPI000C1D25F1|nr:magnesium transporter MRS2-11, chloroplastic-like [Olea europaea var. sylvestris]